MTLFAALLRKGQHFDHFVLKLGYFEHWWDKGYKVCRFGQAKGMISEVKLIIEYKTCIWPEIVLGFRAQGCASPHTRVSTELSSLML